MRGLLRLYRQADLYNCMVRYIFFTCVFFSGSLVADTAKPLVADTDKLFVADTAKPLVAVTAKPLVAVTAKPLVADTAKPLVADTAEPLSCELGNNGSICTGYFDFDSGLANKTIQVNVSLGKYKQVMLPSQIQLLSPKSLSLKDYATFIIAIVAVIGPTLTLCFFYIGRQDRKKDIEKESFNFWLKDVVFPDYFNEIINDLRSLDDLFIETKNDNNTSAKQEFLDYWFAHKLELKKLIKSGANLPFFSDVFTELKAKINNIEDGICYHFYPEEIATVPQNDTIIDSTVSLAEQREPFVSVIHFIYNSMDKKQKNS